MSTYAAVAPPTESGPDPIDGVLEAVLDEVTALLPAGGPSGLADLAQDLAAWVRRPGKRVRPAFARWGWVAAGGDQAGSPELARLGAALELLHLFALVQDDVMDRSDTRRGAPAAHVEAASRHRRVGALGDPTRFGDAVAVLLSDVALSEAASLVAELPVAVRRHWRLMTLELVQGQLLDLTHAASRVHEVGTAPLIAMLKTGRYTVTRPLELGALTAGADPSLVAGLAGWGDLVGEAFALRDDVLGIWGEPERTGKPCGDDLREHKATRLVGWAGEVLPDRSLLEMEVLDDGAVLELTEAMAAAGVRDRAEAEIERLLARADDWLARLTVDGVARGPLTDLARAMAWRDA